MNKDRIITSNTPAFNTHVPRASIRPASRSVGRHLVWSGYAVHDPKGNEVAFATSQVDAQALADAFNCGASYACDRLIKTTVLS